MSLEAPIPMTQHFVKDADAVLDYAVDWSDWLGLDTIVTSTWIVPVGLTKTTDSRTTTTTTIWLSGGQLDVSYEIINHITTAGGRQDDRTLTVLVGEK